MRYLSAIEESAARNFFHAAAEVAHYSKCLRARCGSVIVQGTDIIGKGYNAPPQDICIEKCLKDSLPENFPSDRTCCIHAEQRTIMDALRRNPGKINGSSMYFIRLNEQGNLQKAGKLYCNICSKMALDVGIEEFILWHEEGIAVYDMSEYNELSFNVRKEISASTLPYKQATLP